MGTEATGYSGNLLLKLLALVVTIALLSMPHVAKKVIERFNASNFASAVVAQNREAFERLAEM